MNGRIVPAMLFSFVMLLGVVTPGTAYAGFNPELPEFQPD